MKSKKQKAQKLEAGSKGQEARQKAGLPHILSILLIIIISVAIYSNTLKNGFVFDDEVTIVNNTLIKNLSSISKLFKAKEYFSTSGEMSYRPVVTLTYFIDYAIYGLKPWGYHLTNMLLHAVNGVILYIFLTLLVPRPSSLIPHLSPPLLISLLFVSHPVLTEAVNAISFREDLLCFMFFISALILYLKSKMSVFCLLSSVFLYLLALLSKEMAITFPLIILLYEWLFPLNKPVPEGINRGGGLRGLLFNRCTIGYIAATVVYLYLRFFLFHNPEEDIQAWSLQARLITIPYLILKYFLLLLAPLSLSADYVITPVQSIISFKFIIPFIIIMLVSVLAKKQDMRFGILFFLIILLPVYNIIPIANPFAERYLYLPTAGSAIIVGAGIRRISTIKTSSPIIYILTVSALILSIYSFAVIQRNKIWADNYSLWTDTVRKMPESSKAHNGLGLVYRKQGQFDEAIKEYRMALSLNPDYADVHYNLGNVYEKQGQFDEAIKEYRMALSLNPDYADAHNNLGNAYDKQGKLDEAIKEYKLALSLNPDYADVHYNLGNVYANQGQFDEAIKEYRMALSLKPDFAFAYNNLGLIYEKQGRFDEAIKEYLSSIKFKPDFIATYRNIGRTYIKQNKLDEALDNFLIALKFKPDDPITYYNMAEAYNIKGLKDKAIEELEIAIRLKPDYLLARQTLESLRKK